jgi:Fur family transcriptional regulator, ferric uptake regulator
LVDKHYYFRLLLQPGAIIMSCYTTLKKKGFRLTQPRRVILDYIHDRGDHLTAEEIIRFVHRNYPHVNKSTVYRTLELLEKSECVYKSESTSGIIYHHADEGHHHHLVCRKCGKTIDCEENIFTLVEEALREKYGFHIDFKHVVMNGICDDCKNSK